MTAPEPQTAPPASAPLAAVSSRPPRPAAPTLLTAAQYAGLLKVGDVLIPGDGELPSFSASGCGAEADRMFAYLTPRDRDGLRQLLGVLRWFPRPALRALFAVTSRHRAWPEPAAALPRLLNIGLKGAIMTLYWSDVGPGPSIRAVVGWDARVHDGADAVAGVAEVPAPQDARRTPRPASADGAAADNAFSASGPRPRPEPAPALPPAAAAMAAARAGAASLRRVDLAERAALVRALRQIVLRRREEIVDRIQADTGKSRSDALVSEIFGVLDNLHWLEHHGVRALRDHKEHTPIALMGKKSWTWYEPLGTVLVIAPWNYPFYQAIVPIASAFLAGNTVVHKPSEWTPLTGLVEDLLGEAGFAPHWVQVVYGDGAVGGALVETRPDKVFFTGSTRTGRKVLAAAAPNLVPVELELGGKDAMIVFEDVDVRRAVAGAAWGALTTAGQSCTSVERLYVQRSIYPRFRDALVAEVERLKQEIDTDGDADLGAMTTDLQVKIVAEHVADARAKGARILTGREWNGASRMIPPMVVDDVAPDMRLVREETFGPLIPLLAFDTEAEVIARANDSEYGLTASVWSRDLVRATRVARALAVGGVSINNVMATEANPALPFGGVKQSGFGRNKGVAGLHAFCNVKSVLVDKDSRKIEANWYPYTREKYRLFTDMMVQLFGGGTLALVRFALAGMKLERYAKTAERKR